MEAIIAHGETATTKHDKEAPTKETNSNCTEISTVTVAEDGGCTDGVFTDEPSEKEFLVENNGSFDFEQGSESNQATDANLNGSVYEDKNRSREAEDVREKDYPTESNTLHQHKDDAIEEYDVEKLIKKQKSHYLICPHCKKKITRTVIVVKRRRKKIHVGDGGKKPRKSKSPVGEPTEIDTASEDDEPVPDDQDSDKKPEDDITVLSPVSKDEEKKGEGKEKVDPKPLPISNVNVNDGKPKILVRDFQLRFCSVSPLPFLYIFGLLFLSVFALWFLSASPPQFPSISPEQFPSISLPQFPSISTERLSSTSLLWFVSIFALLFLAILALWFHFSPDRNVETDGKKVDSKSSAPSKVGVNTEGPETPLNKLTDNKTASGDDEPVAGPDRDFHEKPGKKDRPSTHSEDNERSRLPNAGGVAPSQSPSHTNAVTKAEKHRKKPPKQESKPDFATEMGPAKAKETTDHSSTPKDKIKPEEIPIDIPEKGGKIEILKGIVYGGLTQSITSLGIVSSAAGSGASTLNILVLGLANLGSGIMLIVHSLLELKAEKPRKTATNDDEEEEEDRYEQLLGRRDKFQLHVFVVIVSFIVFGVIPPLVYGFSFRKTDKRHYKAAAVLVVSLVCVVSLAIAKAYVAKTREYLKTVFRYTKLAIGASGISYIVGDFVSDLLEKYGFYDDSAEPRRG